MNVEKINALADHMEGLAEHQYDQSSWVMTEPDCYTPGCIAGHCVALFEPEEFQALLDAGDFMGIPLLAEWILDLHEPDWILCPLFDPPDEAVSGENHGEAPTPTDAARVLRHFARTGEVVW